MNKKKKERKAIGEEDCQFESKKESKKKRKIERKIVSSQLA